MYKKEDIRNFYFENETGKRIDCQKIDGNLFLFNVTGLGYAEDIEYEQVGNTFVQKDKKMRQNIIKGDLEFYNMTYDEYCSFVNFILESAELKLIYIPKTKNKMEYYRDIDICEIDKTEEDEYNVLISPITINCKSLWYSKQTAIYNMKKQNNEIRWNFKWDSKFANYDVRKLRHINKGHVAAPVVIEIDGPAKNPNISLYIEGEKYQEVLFNTEILEHEKLLYGTKENDFYINKQNTDGTIESLFKENVINIANNNVVVLPRNKSCEMRLSAENGITNAKITVFEFYKAV